MSDGVESSRKWDSYLLGFARHAATASKDPSTKVGAALVRGRRVLCTGFNGAPQGVRDYPERLERPIKYAFTSHAEENLVATAAKEGIRVEGCSAFVTHTPCHCCARMLIQSGVAEVVYGPEKWSAGDAQIPEVEAMFREAGVRFRPALLSDELLLEIFGPT